VRFKRWQPKAGSWMDWGLRRRSARRRLQRMKDSREAAPQQPDAVPAGDPARPRD
jgi:hypothetical protein